jgi:hypothetical protein
MPPNSFEDATAKALDLLPADDPARSDPRLLRDAKCTEVVRSTQEAAADVWLATSPLRAAPQEVLSSLMAKVEAKAPLARRNVRFFPWLAASGWVAAAIAVILWPRESRSIERVVVMERHAGDRPLADQTQLRAAAATPDRHEGRLHHKLLNLQSRLARAEELARLSAPRVLTLSSPDSIPRTPEEADRRVKAILMGAVRATLEAESGAPDDPASLVIERGWPSEGMVLAGEDGVIRHRNFPEHSWQQHGLRRSEDGEYYDPVRHLIWSPDPEGRGFIGRVADGSDDLEAYLPADESYASASTTLRTQPEGFLIEDPGSDFAEVVIDQVPPAEEGRELQVEWTDALGVRSTMKVAESLAAAVESPAAGNANPVAGVASSTASSVVKGASTLIFSIPNSGGVTSFQLVEVPLLPNGKPRKVIVTGGNGKRKGHSR